MIKVDVLHILKETSIKGGFSGWLDLVGPSPPSGRPVFVDFFFISVAEEMSPLNLWRSCFRK